MEYEILSRKQNDFKYPFIKKDIYECPNHETYSNKKCECRITLYLSDADILELKVDGYKNSFKQLVFHNLANTTNVQDAEQIIYDSIFEFRDILQNNNLAIVEKKLKDIPKNALYYIFNKYLDVNGLEPNVYIDSNHKICHEKDVNLFSKDPESLILYKVIFNHQNYCMTCYKIIPLDKNNILSHPKPHICQKCNPLNITLGDLSQKDLIKMIKIIELLCYGYNDNQSNLFLMNFDIMTYISKIIYQIFGRTKLGRINIMGNSCVPRGLTSISFGRNFSSEI